MLVLALAIAGALALTIHVAMLSGGVPFPVSKPPAWARWANMSLVIAAVLAFLRLLRRLRRAQPGIQRFLAHTLLSFVILATLRETFRAAIMNGIVTGGWVYSAAGLVDPLLRTLVLSVLCAAAAAWVRNAWTLILVALVTTALYMGAQTLCGLALAPFKAEIAPLAQAARYTFPYPFHVNVAAYLTFLEPVSGTALLLALVWQQLAKSMLGRLLAAALLVALLKGVVGAVALYSFFSQQGPLLGMLGYSQFLFEFLALGFLAGLAWHAYGHSSRESIISATSPSSMPISPR